MKSLKSKLMESLTVKLWINVVSFAAIALVLGACSTEEQPAQVEARATFHLDRVLVNEEVVEVADTSYDGSTLIFIGEEAGGNVLIRVGETVIQASINPSREHPSFEAGYWHHHLYEGNTAAGSPRINFLELLPELNIDMNPEATDPTQSSYQHGNLHYIVETGEFRLRFTINGDIHDLIFMEV